MACWQSHGLSSSPKAPNLRVVRSYLSLGLCYEKYAIISLWSLTYSMKINFKRLIVGLEDQY
jgi:hypothetical protein